jgi:hypothetical protein
MAEIKPTEINTIEKIANENDWALLKMKKKMVPNI